MSAAGWPAQYETRVAGVLDDRWAPWFDGLQISGQGEETVICGPVANQPALHGLLTKVRDLWLCLDLRAPAGHRPGRKPGTMIRPSLRRGRGLASYYVTASLLWPAGITAVTAPSPQVTCARS